jgi:hyperosmotically inducible protein
MIGSLLRAVLLIVLIAAAAAFFLGYRLRSTPDGYVLEGPSGQVVGSSGTIDSSKAREVGAELGQKATSAANTAVKSLDDGALTTKIKAKMALDDVVKALDINVDTTNGVVTLTGRVATDAERDRAVQLAKETEGVRGVTNNIQVR